MNISSALLNPVQIEKGWEVEETEDVLYLKLYNTIIEAFSTSGVTKQAIEKVISRYGVEQ